MFLKNKNIIFKFRRSKVTDYAALMSRLAKLRLFSCFTLLSLSSVHHTREKQFSSILQPNANCKGCTALHYAALVDDSTSVEELLKAGKLQ